jgi:uncharacterized protein (DUF58 family)
LSTADTASVAGATLDAATVDTGGPIQTRLHRRKIYILPTHAGGLFVLALATMLLGSINYNSSLGYLLTFWLAAVSLVSLFHTYRNLAALRVVSGRSPPVFVGELAGFEVNLGNDAAYSRHGVMARFRSSEDPDAPYGGASVVSTEVAAKDRARIVLPVRATRRGWLTLDDVTISTRYPFGIFRAWSRVDTQQAVLVYPAPAGSPNLPLHDSGDDGQGVAGGRGNEDYVGLRGYQPGDPIRQIHWKLAARSDDLTVKEFGGTLSADLILDVESVSGSMEARLSQLVMWVLEAQAGGFRYGLKLAGTRVAAGTGDAHMHICLTHLALHGSAKR